MYNTKRFCYAGFGFLILAQITHGLESINLQLKWQHQFQFAGYYAAQVKGFYEEVDLEVNIIEGDSHVNIIERVTQGHADYGTGNSDILLAHHEGAPVVILAAIMQHSPYVLVTRKDQSFQTIHDMAGKRLMIEPHAAELIAYLSREGIEPGSYQSYPYTALQRFIDGEVDAVSVYVTDEPWLLEQQDIKFNTYYPASAGIDFYGDNLFTTKAELKNHPDRVRRFREASMRGWDYALNHPEEIVDYIVQVFPDRHSREHLLFEAKRMRQLMYSDLIEMGYMLPGRWQHIADIYKDLGLLPRNYSMEDLLYSPQTFVQYSKQLVRALAGWAITIVILLVIGVLTFKLYRLNKKLHTSLEYKNQLANVGESISNISHQWKQPLNELGIQFMRIQQLVARQSDKELEEIDQLVEKGNELLQFMANTVDAFGVVVGNRNQLVRFSPKKAIEDLLRLQQDSFLREGIKVSLDLNDAAELYGNVASFIQSVMNVMGNARDALVERDINNPHINVVSTMDENSCLITVTDNAGGLDSSQIKRVFDIGYSDKSKGGSGLGLYIARKIIRDEFHGSLIVKHVDNGLCFEFSLPLFEK